MVKSIKALIRLAGTRGLYVPHAYDAANKVPSVRLLFAVITFACSIASLAALHNNPHLLLPTGATVTFFVICMIFYMLRDLDKAKINLQEKSIELEDTHEKEEK